MTSKFSRPLRTGLFYALRTAFRLTPMPEATRDKLRQRFLDRHGELVPPGPKGYITGCQVRRPYLRSDERAVGYVPYQKQKLPDPLPATLVAFYLPQFHTIPENDEWWGKGFTEWRNVTRAVPQFEGHLQPRLPGDLGFYDLRNPEVMREQARLAREYGISAFCFYFYWFGGKTLLEAPLRNWLADPTIDLSFCLCWANEKWSRRWDGRGDDILIDQQHSAEDDLAFIAHVAEYLRDSRYLRVDGKPALMLYRPGLLPDAAATAGRWRQWCRENGIGEIHLIYVQGFERPHPAKIGFDAAVEFPPNLTNPTSVAPRLRLINPNFSGQVLDWRELARECVSRPHPAYCFYPCVNAGWDNEPRRAGMGRVFFHASPALYSQWLSKTILLRLGSTEPSKRLVFINAWNEWAEGAVLEPDAASGYAWLHHTRMALQISSTTNPATLDNNSPPPCVVIHAWYADAFDQILAALQETGRDWRIVVTTSEEKQTEMGRLLDHRNLSASFAIFENRGRDILPFLRVAGLLMADGVEVVLKLHTKRSPHLTNGDQWRKELVAQLLSSENIEAACGAFAKNRSLGLLATPGHLLPLGSFLGANCENIQFLATQLGVEYSPETPFPAGSMFWVRLSALQSLVGSHLLASSFEEEAGQVDGTMAHAVERMIAACALSEGLLVQELAHRQNTPDAYRYAKPSN